MLLRFAVITVLLLAAFGSPAGAQEQPNILSFYPTADSITEYPPLEKDLSIVCQKKIFKNYVTFIGRKGIKNIFIAAVTMQPMKDVKKELSLHVTFDGIKPGMGKTTTWGYVFDRNNDGKIDYMALVAGAVAVEDSAFDNDFPVRDQHLSLPQTEEFISHCQLVFNHWADDNYDGALDALVQTDMDPIRDWAKRHIVVRSTKFDGKFDDVWTFNRWIGGDRDTVEERTPASVFYRPIGAITGHITQDSFKQASNILRLLNRAAKACKVGKIQTPDE